MQLFVGVPASSARRHLLTAMAAFGSNFVVPWLVCCPAPAAKHMAAAGTACVWSGPKLLLTDSDRAKLDSNPDTLFYRTPRMMQHADPEALTAISSKLVFFAKPRHLYLVLAELARSAA